MKQIGQEKKSKKNGLVLGILEKAAAILILLAAFLVSGTEEAEAGWLNYYGKESRYSDSYVDDMYSLLGNTYTKEKLTLTDGYTILALAVDGSGSDEWKLIWTQSDVTERTFPLRRLLGFFPFFSETSYTTQYRSSNKDDQLTFDMDEELSLDTAFRRMGVDGDEDSVTTWYHVDSEEDFEYMMSLAQQDSGVKILLGYTYKNYYDGTTLMRYISSGGETEYVDRLVGPGYVSGSNTDADNAANSAVYGKLNSTGYDLTGSIKEAGWYLFRAKQYLGSTYVLNGDYSYTSDMITNQYYNEIEACPDYMVTRTTPASFILHADSTNQVKLETMDGTEGSGKYLVIYDGDDVKYEQIASEESTNVKTLPGTEETSETYTYSYYSSKWANKFYPEVYEVYENALTGHKNAYNTDSTFYIQYETKDGKLRLFQIGDTDITLKLNNSQTLKRNNAWGYSRLYEVKYQFSAEQVLGPEKYTTSGKDRVYYKFLEFDKVSSEVTRDHPTTSDNVNLIEVTEMTFVSYLTGTELGWSVVGHLTTNGDGLVEGTPTFAKTKNVVTMSGSEKKAAVPNWKAADDLKYSKYEMMFYLYGYDSVPEDYILGVNPEQDYMTNGFDVWFGIDGVPKSMLAAGAGDTSAETKNPAEEEVNPEDASAGVIKSGADIYIVSKAENPEGVGNFYSTKTNSVLYLPADQEIVISEDGVLVVASNSVLVLQGNIINYGQIIVQPGGVITYLQSSSMSDLDAGIINIGGSMLVREGGKVRVRYLLSNTSDDYSFADYLTEHSKNNSNYLYKYLRDLSPGNTESVLDIRGTVLVTWYLGLLEGTDVKLSDSGYLLMKDFDDTTLNNMLGLTAAEWAEKATKTTYERYTFVVYRADLNYREEWNVTGNRYRVDEDVLKLLQKADPTKKRYFLREDEIY